MSIEAMRQMVAELEYVLDCINSEKIPFDGDDFHEALRLGRQAIAEAEKQEPVAYLMGDYFEFAEHAEDYEKKNGTPLYTHPQQRTWVGLSDTDLAVCGDEDDVMLARYWERVCKEKNT